MSEEQRDVLLEERPTGTDVPHEPEENISPTNEECRLPVCKSASAALEVGTSGSQSELRQTSSGPQCDVNKEESGGDEGVTEMLKSFVLAVHQKYNDDTHVADAVGNVVLVPKRGPVKMTASGSIMLPRQVTMSGCEISVAGDPQLIQRMCQKVQELDLMENHIKKWEEVFAIVRCIPHLTFLNLTKNHISCDFPNLDCWTSSCLKHLVLNDTLVTWDVLIKLLDVFPLLEELHLSVNEFQSVDFSTGSSLSTPLLTYPSLRKLFFIRNKVFQWSELSKLGSFFPGLQFLMLSETEIETTENGTDIQMCFPSLSVLGLNRTQLKSWEDVEKLRHFPSLTDVRLNGIPFLEAFDEKFKRWHTVALLPNIHFLNGSPVLENEREDAERAFIRLYMDSPDKPHRYFELEQQHGRLDPLVKVELKPKKRVRLLVKVESSSGDLKSSELMDIDVSQNIKDLKKLLSNVAGCPTSKLTLFYLDPEGYCGLERLMSMERKVHSYKMKDGDEIVIVIKDS
ncbi:tubulin-specific chaperone cofactor E-like protein [Aplysia californica]|uniref:Tubulin-specific chaperone cofactor E-like protein n=1 Tax=Aplysia californica TaxID=6500 RepID=A0ABM1AFS5_APLCA|nr:tubulin-specific chaperone cofactor E-like protein [Aplysia californica]